MREYLMIRVKLVIFIFFSFISCRENKLKILYNEDFQTIVELARKDNKPFCLVLSGSSCPLCSQYFDHIEKLNNESSINPIFNIIDTDKSEYRWYHQWIGTAAKPTTCVFSPEGNLIAVIPGASIQSFQCVKNSIKRDSMCSGFFYNLRYSTVGYLDVFDTLNKILKCKIDLDNGKNISEDISKTLRLQYPYNEYLQILNAYKHNLIEEQQVNSDYLMRYGDAHSLFLYDDLFKEIKYLQNPNYNPEIAPILTLNNSKLEMNCEIGVPHNFSILLKNSGKELLLITDIQLSCNCLKLLSSKNFQIPAGEEKSVDLVFEADELGEIYREVTFFSNADNSIETVSIVANVKNKIPKF